jgi:hypothetical protein
MKKYILEARRGYHNERCDALPRKNSFQNGEILFPGVGNADSRMPSAGSPTSRI